MKFLITYSILYHIYYQISSSTLSLKFYKHIRIISRFRVRAFFRSFSLSLFLSLSLSLSLEGKKK